MGDYIFSVSSFNERMAARRQSFRAGMLDSAEIKGVQFRSGPVRPDPKKTREKLDEWLKVESGSTFGGIGHFLLMDEFGRPVKVDKKEGGPFGGDTAPDWNAMLFGPSDDSDE